MIIPLHLIPAQSRLSLDGVVEAGQPAVMELPDLGLTIAGPVPAPLLQAFQVLMQQQGLPLQPTRMLYDRLYAFERLADAYASESGALQDLAMQLFERYQTAGEWIGLLH